MKNIFRFVTYSLLSLMFLTGLAIFIFRNNIAAYVAGPEISLSSSVPSSGAMAALDLGPLSEPRFLSLKNNIVNFDFNNICHRPAATISPIKTLEPAGTTGVGTATSTATTTVPAAPASCVTGNSLPFFSKTK